MDIKVWSINEPTLSKGLKAASKVVKALDEGSDGWATYDMTVKYEAEIDSYEVLLYVHNVKG
jgi:hypothetical protein